MAAVISVLSLVVAVTPRNPINHCDEISLQALDTWMDSTQYLGRASVSGLILVSLPKLSVFPFFKSRSETPANVDQRCSNWWINFGSYSGR